MILKTKVGEHVDIRTIAKQVIIEKGGIAKAADFVQAGIHAADVVNMCNAGYLDRIRHGYYQLAEADTSSEEQLLAVLIPKGIVCVESALFIMDIAISLLVNGLLLYQDLCLGQNWK